MTLSLPPELKLLSLWKIFLWCWRNISQFFWPRVQTPVLHSLVAIDPSKRVSPPSGTLSSSQKAEEFTFHGLIVSHEREKSSQARICQQLGITSFFWGGGDVAQSPMVISCRYNQIISKEAVGAHRKWNKEANLHLSALSNVIMCQQNQANCLAEKHYGFFFSHQ